MDSIGHLWAGQIYGTNTGKVFAELENRDGAVVGTLRLNDDQHGVAVLRAVGKFSTGRLTLKATEESAAPDVEFGQIDIEGELTPEGQIRGRWSSTLGTAGTFILFPHDQGDLNRSTGSGTPEQIHTATKALGALRLYKDDLQELVGFVCRDFRNARPVITYNHRGHEVSRYADQLDGEFYSINKLHYIKIYAQEPDDFRATRFVQVELTATGSNTIRAQGVQESWVIGKAETLERHLRYRKSALSTTARWAGLNVNAFIALAALVLLPDLPLERRILFAGLVVAIIWVFNQLHSRFIPNVVVYLSDRSPSWIEKSWPQILSWMIAATSAIAASVAYGLLKGELLIPSLTWPLPT